MKTVLFSSSTGDINAQMAFQNNLEATTNPGATDDSSKGYEAGSQWVNLTSKVAYVCVDATVGAAVWTTGGGETTPGEVVAPDASTPTGVGGTASLTGGKGGTTSGNGGPANVVGGAAQGGNSVGGAAALTGGAGHGTGAGAAATVSGGASGAGATGNGGAASLEGGNAASTNGVGGAATVSGGNGTGTGNGAPVVIEGGTGGATSGTGGTVTISGGPAGTGSNANGADVNIAGGAKDGSGIGGVIRHESIVLNNQGAPASQDTAATLTAAQILAGILTSNPSGAINLQLPLATALDAALPTSAAGDSFDLSVISLAGSTNLPTLTTNTGWTLVGSMVATAVAGSAALYRARKTAAGAWTLYRIAG